MKTRPQLYRTLSILRVLGFSLAAPAQSLVVTNARVIDGTGRVIDRGSVVTRDGKIASVVRGGPSGRSAGRRIDVPEMTVMASFIGAHRHIIRADATAWLKDYSVESMKSFVDASFTTLFSMGDDPHAILELRRRLSSGEISGPTRYAVRIIPLAAPAPGSPPAPRKPLYRSGSPSRSPLQRPSGNP